MADIFGQVNGLRKLYNGFKSARVLLTANNYRIFDHLTTPNTARAISRKLKIDFRAAEILLDALTGMGLLKKKNSKYRNTVVASRFLVSGLPFYQGDIIKHADALWDNWSGLDKVVKSGAPYHKSRNHNAFILGMHNLAVLKAAEVIKEVGLKGVKSALDLGAGPGTYAMEMAKNGAHVTLFDTPETIKIARNITNKSRIKNIDFIQGDFLRDNIGKGYDLIFISQIMHAYSNKDNIALLMKCKKALNKGGRVVIQEFFINESRTYPIQSALFSINMLVNTYGGRSYSPNEMKGWFLKTGFKNIRKKFIADNILISAEKS
jgi:ubiquinone/menaquinone biosynthesis C-methylase UbiE